MLRKDHAILLSLSACLVASAVSGTPTDPKALTHTARRADGGLFGRWNIPQFLPIGSLFGDLLKLGSGIRNVLGMFRIRLGRGSNSRASDFTKFTIDSNTDISRLVGHELSWEIQKDAAAVMGKVWKNVALLKFPSDRRLVVLQYPNGVLSVVSKGTDAVTHVNFKNGKEHVIGINKKIRMAFQFFSTMQIAKPLINMLMLMLGDCLPLPGQTVKINNALISEIKTGPGTVCGLRNLSPSINVTISKDAETRLIIEMPFNLPNLHVQLRHLEVPNLIEGEPVEVKIKKATVKVLLKFKYNKIFARFSIRLEALEGFEMKFQSEKSRIMEFAEDLSGVIGDMIRTEINKKFESFEKLGGEVEKNLVGFL